MAKGEITTTIAAIATPVGRGGIGVIRISGPDALVLGESITGHKLKPRLARYGPFFHPESKQLLDQGIALYFPGPNSFTGEDVLELQAHGSPIVLDLLLQAIISQGARLARPGEFSERAYLNNKMDLTQAMTLEFEPPDYERFPALQLGHEVAKMGGTVGIEAVSGMPQPMP